VLREFQWAGSFIKGNVMITGIVAGTVSHGKLPLSCYICLLMSKERVVGKKNQTVGLFPVHKSDR